jgi:hypothetical protein
VRLLLVLLLLAGCAPSKKSEAPRGKVSAEIADKGPRLVGNPPTVQIELPPRMTAALLADSGFVTLSPFDFVRQIAPGDTAAGAWHYPYDGRQAPFAVIGDFDGDGRDDVAMLQRSDGPALMKAEGRVLVVFDRAGAPVAVTATSWNTRIAGEGRKSGFYLTRFPAGAFKVPDFGGSGDSARTVTLPHEGIEVSNYGKTAATYWWTGSTFESVTTAD